MADSIDSPITNDVSRDGPDNNVFVGDGGLALATDTPYDGDQSKSVQAFIGSITGQIDCGYGFIPFIGAGFSSPSGAPLIYEIEEYLQRCICISLGIDGDDDGGHEGIEAWNPRTDQWPPFIDRSRVFDRGHWSKLLFEQITKSRSSDDPNQRARLRVMSEGFGAMQDWRTSLLFLSRLTHRWSRSDPKRPSESALEVCLDVPQQEVIDSCFREALKDKYPSLNHRMLAALAGAMRIDVVLTTNFDNLLESAFEHARNPLEVFEVPIGGSLPNWSAVSNVRALVKLHGGRSSLRADYSLDQEPSSEDKRTLLRYLLSAKERKRFEDSLLSSADSASRPNVIGGGFRPQNNLIVMGFSAADRRIRALIEYAWNHLDSNFKVYWLCYSEDDVRGVCEFIQQSSHPSNVDVESLKTETVLRHTQAGLFLLQLYQSLRKTLPPLGSVFPSVSRLTLPPLEPRVIKQELASRVGMVSDFRAEILSHLERFAQDFAGKHKVILATAVPGTSGITSVCARVYREIENRYCCLWIDMDDISSADNLFEVLLESIYYRLGFEDWIPATVQVDSVGGVFDTSDENVPWPPASHPLDRRGREIDRLISSVNKRWIVFLNAYESPGANTSDEQDSEGLGWMDMGPDVRKARNYQEKLNIGPFADQSDNAESLIKLLEALCGPKSRMSVVLMCRPTSENIDFVNQVDHQNRVDATVVKLVDTFYPQKTFFVEQEIAEAAIAWAKPDEQKRRFLHGLSLMQRPRHISSIWSPALTPHCDSKLIFDARLEWLEDLEERKLIRRKSGGMIWIHAPCRQRIRQHFANLRPVGDVSLGEIHKNLAEWYEKVLDSSDTPAAVFEATHHFCQAALAFLRSDVKRSRVNLEAATALLRSNAFLIQTHGYSRGSCRRLEHIASIGLTIWEQLPAEVRSPPKRTRRHRVADSEIGADTIAAENVHVATAVRSLWTICAEIMRAIAREVGEDSKAYYRHRQARRLADGLEDWRDVQEPQSVALRGSVSHEAGRLCSIRRASWRERIKLCAPQRHGYVGGGGL